MSEGRIRRTAPVWLLLGLLSALGCASVKVTTDYDPAYDFSQLRRFDWLPVKPSPEPTEGEEMSDALLAKRVRSAVEQQLVTRGFLRSSESPDFFVHWHSVVRSKIDIRTYPAGAGYGSWGYPYSRGGWWGGTYVDVRQYDEGTLVVDVIDADSRSLVWRGAGSRVMRDVSEPEERIGIVNDAVRRILHSFPPIPPRRSRSADERP